MKRPMILEVCTLQLSQRRRDSIAAASRLYMEVDT
jgi:hypothetical protein